jgi:hypothetical protein
MTAHLLINNTLRDSLSCFLYHSEYYKQTEKLLLSQIVYEAVFLKMFQLI